MLPCAMNCSRELQHLNKLLTDFQCTETCTFIIQQFEGKIDSINNVLFCTCLGQVPYVWSYNPAQAAFCQVQNGGRAQTAVGNKRYHVVVISFTCYRLYHSDCNNLECVIVIRIILHSKWKPTFLSIFNSAF